MLFHAENGDINSAITCWNKALRIDQNTSRAWYNLGKYFMATDKLEEAIKYFNRTVTIEPSYVPAWNNMAMAYEKAGRMNDAIRCIDKATENDPNGILFRGLEKNKMYD